ncbi:MAG: zinc finger domain-containing protein [Candidatus Aenigmatarchaeota archaeon]
MRCSSCQVGLKTEDGWARFKCPNCGEAEIFRCARCRKQSIVYTCPKCEFEGP